MAHLEQCIAHGLKGAGGGAVAELIGPGLDPVDISRREVVGGTAHTQKKNVAEAGED